MTLRHLTRPLAAILATAMVLSAPLVVAAAQTPRVRVGGNIKEPKKLKDVKPAYPEDAKAAGIEGSVIIEAVISTEGLVTETKLLRSVPLLDNAAVEAVQQWKYTPTLLNGEPVEVLMTVVVTFKLSTP